MFRVEAQGAVDVIMISAPLNHEHAAELREQIKAEQQSGKPMVVLCMKETPLIDSAGLESLLDVNEHLQQRGGQVKLAAANPLCREILRITGVADHFELYPDVKGAVGSFVQ